MSIQAIDQTSVHRLTSGQVVIDLQTAVKELLENALDAGASAVEVRFKEFGVEAIEVQDNGRGIEESDWAGIALKHHTSKLTTFSDLTTVDTLGFRGEALSSLCGTATLSIQTATASTAPAGTSLTFEPSGTCVVGGKVARSKGTTVVVKELFRALPVRRKELIKNAKREFGKAVELVQSYALIRTGCRIEVKNTVKGKSTTHLQTPVAPTLRANFSSIFAPKALSSMLDLDLVLDVAADKSVLKWSETGSQGSTQVLVKGLISKPTTGSGRTTSNRQFFYVNGRPFSPTKVAKSINEVYKSFNTGSFPCVVADFQLPPDSYDVNVSPDKRTIFLHSEGNLITALKTALEELYQPSRSTFVMSQIGPSKATSSAKVARKDSKVSATSAASSRHASSSSSNLQPALSDNEAEDAERPVKRKRGLSVASTDIDKSDFGEDDDADRMDCADPGRPHGEGLNEADAAARPFPKRAKADDEPLRRTSSSSRAPSPPASPPASLRSSPLKSFLRSPLAPVPMELDAVDQFQPDEAPSRSPSPSPPPPKLRQLTLDTTGASWAQATTGEAPKGASASDAGAKEKNLGGGRMGLNAAVKNLRQFSHPSQQASAMDVDELEEEGEEEEGEGEEEGDGVEEEEEAGAAAQEEDEVMGRKAVVEVAAEEAVAVNSDDELLVVEDSFRAGTPTPRRASTSDEPLIISDDDEPPQESFLLDTTLEQERLEHLASLDVVAGPSTGIDPRTYRDEIVVAQSATDTTVAFDFAAVAAEWSTPFRSPTRSRSKASTSSDPLAGASVDEDIDRAEETLSRVVSKEDFASMQVVGQFNLGFIIARRRTQASASAKGKEKATEDDNEDLQDDLFIIDQHASDEKYNFERLQEDTVIQSQRLLHPRPLNMPSHEEITAMEHLDVLKMNGFEVVVDEEADVGQRVKLIAQPVSKDTVFGVEDLEELLDLINSRSAGEMVRPSKARKMFASRACRKSVMIGKALNVNQMTTVVRHMGGMDQPWACPHGRPTMRWLAGLGTNVRVEKRNNLAAVLLSYSELD